MRRGVLLLAALLLTGPAAAGCSGAPWPGGDPEGEPAAEALVAALNTGDFDDVPLAPGTSPQEVAQEYDEVLDGLDDLEHQVVLSDVSSGPEDDTVTARLGWSWEFDEGGPWTYRTDARLVRSGSEDDDPAWHVTWERSLILPSLAPEETLTAARVEADRAPILDRAGDPLVTDRPVSRVGVDKTRAQRPAALARAARRVARATDIAVPDYVRRVQDAGDRAFVEALTYRNDQVPPEVIAVLEAEPAAVGVSDELPLAPSRTFAAEILGRSGQATAEMVEEEPDLYRPGDVAGLSGLQRRYDEQLRGVPGLAIRAIDADGGSREVHRVEPTAGEPLQLTLDTALQRAAERGLADLTGVGSALVAVKPSTGAVLAAANGPGNGGLNHATFGQFPPGSTFKIVSSLALLRSGLGPDDPVECTGSTTVHGKRFGNYSEYPTAYVGAIPLRRAVAHSCNTAFINARDRLAGSDLADAAASLGFGIDHDVGFPAFYGQVEPDPSRTGAAAQLIGQGTVLASPMAMTAVVGSVQAGQTVVPWLVDTPGADRAVPEEAQPLDTEEVRALRTMLRAVVTEGSGRLLADLAGPPVLAKTGTAEFGPGDRQRTHAWMVAARGDLAVAVFVEEGDSGSSTAGPVLAGFLRAAPQ